MCVHVKVELSHEKWRIGDVDSSIMELNPLRNLVSLGIKKKSEPLIYVEKKSKLLVCVKWANEIN